VRKNPPTSMFLINSDIRRRYHLREKAKNIRARSKTLTTEAKRLLIDFI
jgi:hypothetical protein